VNQSKKWTENQPVVGIAFLDSSFAEESDVDFVSYEVLLNYMYPVQDQDPLKEQSLYSEIYYRSIHWLIITVANVANLGTEC